MEINVFEDRIRNKTAVIAERWRFHVWPRIIIRRQNINSQGDKWVETKHYIETSEVPRKKHVMLERVNNINHSCHDNLAIEKLWKEITRKND